MNRNRRPSRGVSMIEAMVALAIMGFGMGLTERHIYDPQNGLPANVGLYQAKPVSYLDIPSHLQTLPVGEQDPQNPVGAKGIGEAATIGATPAMTNAVIDALSYWGIEHLDIPFTPEKVWRAISFVTTTPSTV